MITNKEIAGMFNTLASYMELYGENAFKIRSYQSAYMLLRKVDKPLINLNIEQLEKIDGVGKAIAQKISDISQQGVLPLLEEYKNKTPEGVSEMLEIKGLGAKKVITLWKDYDIVDLYQLNEFIQSGKLLNVKGFGQKTIDKIKENIQLYEFSKGKVLYPTALQIVEKVGLRHMIEAYNEDGYFQYITDMALKRPIVESIDCIAERNLLDPVKAHLASQNKIDELHFSNDVLRCRYENNIPINIYISERTRIEEDIYLKNETPFANSLYGSEWKKQYSTWKETAYAKLPPEFLDMTIEQWDKVKAGDEEIVQEGNIKGVVHLHTTYSDGVATLLAMAEACRAKGYEYMVVTDHSKAAFYANGLDEDRLAIQMKEIDQLNTQWEDFRILKGVECDIRNDGSMDLDDSILSELDVVIASIHSNLGMDETTAMKRLLCAVSHPHVDILGHMTGRILLSRKGYPIDHQAVIDACKTSGTTIELNANPSRLDIDYSFLLACQEAGVKISINPDAHSIGGIDDIQYGVIAARKGGLLKQNCVNTLSCNEFINSLK